MSSSARGLGPFSGGQLTMIVCVIAAAVAFPVGAWAVVSGSNVFVTDATSGAHAAVSASGAVSVSGSVSANNATPKSLYSAFTPLVSHRSPVAVPPAGKALVITSIVVDTFSDSSPGGNNDAVFGVSSGDATCSSVLAVVADDNPPTVGVSSTPIPSGLVIPANRALCAQQDGALGAEAEVFGYLVAASSAPAGAATPGHGNAPVQPTQNR